MPPLPLDPAPLRRRHAECLDQARRLRYRLSHELPTRAAPAQHWLGAAAALPAALAATEPDVPLAPRRYDDQQGQLRQLHNAALHELETRSGPAPVALLRARLTGLLAEAEVLAQALADSSSASLNPDDSEIVANSMVALILPPSSNFFTHSSSLMAYSINNLTTKADCDRVLGPLALKRDEAANRKSNLAFRLQNFNDPAARAAEITRLNRRVSEGQTELATMAEGKLKRDLEDEVSISTRRRNQLLNQADTQGSDDRLLVEFELEIVTKTFDEAVTLIPQIEARKAALPA